ncbi:MAG TPA: L-seryl-tRNA(Sec) selenium transferase [Blastocatellia bacterium]|nr:L-seryl-tRNA(Sec) selenium transferase [Blastocatellia bacterium]HMX25063.1 L-seryl-tRNA(Sec) selenium transferase [Blastocatellia bacterium]HMZ17509.1 L-seryl-tRNA(Sec) selenium transferase [Blastocatellia bacterium]HNG33391.1 L-seryl-tRNA(Sec) selenium transferase [Blastocatellia bacterium]
MNATLLRSLPSVDQLLRRENLQSLIADAGRDAVRDRLREVLEEFRQELVQANGNADSFADADQLTVEIERRLRERFARRQRANTRRVINATGVVLHTNLGRAPLSRAALDAINEVAQDYCNLEYDLTAGKRGKRGVGLEAGLRELLGCEAAAVVNNCAAAMLITLNTLGEGGEVLVSRGELIEIGGSFRIPDVIAKSGARIREVGTTNRTRLSDYERAINEHTKVILRCHPSNYRIVGFTEKPALEDLARLARERGLPLLEDLGSGCLLDLNPLGIHDEPTIAQSLRAGASVLTFSGDKLLGGPQAGIILGEAERIKQIKSNPLMRALRVDKLTYAALEATIEAYLSGRALEEIPVQVALHLSKEEITRRARAFIRRARKLGNGLVFKLIDGHSVIGGGSAPETQLPTTLIAVSSLHLNANVLEEKLRLNSPPIIARIVEDRLTLDLRTVVQSAEPEILAALGNPVQ